MTTQNKPTIAQILPALNIGGVEQACLDIIPAISKEGFIPLVISGGGINAKQIKKYGGTHIQLDVGNKNPLNALHNLKQLKKIIKIHNITLIHAHSRLPAWLAHHACRNNNTKFITSFHAAYNYSNTLKHRYNSIMARGQKVIAVSNFIKNHILTNYNDYVNESNIHVIYNAINCSRFDKAQLKHANNHANNLNLYKLWNLPQAKWLVLVSRPSASKGHALAIKALSELSRFDVNLLCVVPDINSPSVKQLQQLAQSCNVTKRVYIRSGIAEPEQDILPSAYGLADICLSASTQPESFGRTVVEAQALGRVVLAPAFGGALEQISDGHNGFLFKPNSPESLIASIEKILSLSHSQRSIIGEQAYHDAHARFSQEVIGKQILALYHQVIRA